jgi:hypothetical protein
MGPDNVIEAFANLQASDQIRFLVRLSWELTLVGRNFYVVGTDELTEPRALRTLNELQHQISQHVLKLLEEDEERYPDDVFVNIILDHRETAIPQFSDLIDSAWERAFRSVGPGRTASDHAMPSSR